MKNADTVELEELLEPLGLQRKKAKALVKIGKKAADSGVPRDEERLLTFPHVGQYAANAVLCFGFDERRAIVDANVVRILNRVFDEDFKGGRDGKAWDMAEKLLPEENFRAYNLGLLDLGAQVCTPSNPDCNSCPINGECRTTKNTHRENEVRPN